jgi:2-oxoglutarate ferredoxin oxidoreductase subunit beta
MTTHTHISEITRDYFRLTKKFPHVWCAGCGNGIVLGSLLRAIAELELDPDKICVVSGIGCSSRLPVYVDFNTLHTEHGRAVAFATGLKFARPELTVIVITGDGDCTAIGGNHFIHACRRNIDITTIIFNNFIYGMTGGQFSPTTPTDSKATTAPYGNVEQAFDICKLAEGAGATFVGRSTAYHTKLLDTLIRDGISHKGFSVVEAVVQCPTYFGRFNAIRNPLEMLLWQKDHAVNIKAAAKMQPEALEGKFLIGLLTQKDMPEYTAKYAEMAAGLQEAGNV